LGEATAAADQEFLAQFGRWSEHVKGVWCDAWNQTCMQVDALFPEATTFRHYHPCQPGRFIELQPNEGLPGTAGHHRYRPYRRVYQGGDDLSFVCDARIALGMAAILAERLQANAASSRDDVPAVFRSMAVSVGVAFVDSHFPFSRAVRMAEEVRRSAKKKAVKNNRDQPRSYLDWWVNREGALQRAVRLSSVKPVPLVTDASNSGEVGWQEMEHTVLAGMWRQFGDSRNKLKDLIAAAEDGPGAVEALLAARPVPEAALGCLPSGFGSMSGFLQDSTPLIDAGELLDIHFPFGRPEEPAVQPKEGG
jgi:hypothetical protein